jgi:hypothetical protein
MLPVYFTFLSSILKRRYYSKVYKPNFIILHVVLNRLGVRIWCPALQPYTIRMLSLVCKKRISGPGIRLCSCRSQCQLLKIWFRNVV